MFTNRSSQPLPSTITSLPITESTDYCQVLGGGPFSEEQASKQHSDVLRLLTEPQVESRFVKFGQIKSCRYITSGQYSGIYKLRLNGVGTCNKEECLDQRKKLILKTVSCKLCPKRSNYKNELQVSQLIKDNPHENLIQILDIIEWKCSHFWLVMEDGGKMDLCKFLHKNPNGCVSSPIGKQLFGQLIDAVQHLHCTLRVVHRDIKPENIMIQTSRHHNYPKLDHDLSWSTGGAASVSSLSSVKTVAAGYNVTLKLVDFGFAKVVSENFDNRHQALCSSHKGTLEYMAPELLVNCFEYDAFKTDIYSTGVILYEMLFGKNPFGPINNSQKKESFFEILQMYRMVKSRPIDFELPFTSTQNLITDNVRKLIQSILNVNPCDRPTLEEIKTHSWLNSSSEV